MRTLAALAFLLAATLSSAAAPRSPSTQVPPPPVQNPQYPQYPGGWFRPYVSSPYGPSGPFRNLAPNDTQNSIEYQLDMGAGSGRY